MTYSSWKKIIGVSLGIFALFFGSVGLTGCEFGGEELEEEEEVFEEEELEEEEDD